MDRTSKDMRTQLPRFPNLPVMLTGFVGRKREVADISKLLASSPIVSLVGTGGCGKTRIALRVAEEVGHQFTDGVCWIEFARLTDPTFVPQMVAKTLNIAEASDRPLSDALRDTVQDKHMLLVLDNCEHLLGACAHLVELLISAPQVRILVTSREALGMLAEVQYLVLPLPVLATRRPFAEIEQSDAVRLFVERARRILPDFAVTPENAEVIADICRSLDGIPLAIELASGRVNVLSVHQIFTRLSQRFDLLVSKSRDEGRHNTLRAAIDWSYALLSPSEKLLLQRLAVFASGFTLNTAEAVCAWGDLEGDQVLDLITSLVNKSLVVSETMKGSEARYHLLETIRQYAQEKLNAGNEWAILQDRQLTYFVQRTEEVAPKLREQYQPLWLNWLESELDNLRMTMAAALQHGRIEDGLRIATALYKFWELRGHVLEGITWFDRLLSAPDSTLPLDLHVNALVNESFLAMFLRDGEKSKALSQRAVDLCEAAGESDKALLYFALAGLGSAAVGAGDSQLAYDITSRLVTHYRATDDVFSLGMTLFIMGVVTTDLGKYETAHQSLEESLAMARQANDPYRTANVLKALGELARCEQDYHRALECYAESLALYEQLDARRDVPDIKRHLAYVFMQQRDVGKTRHLLDEALQGHTELDNHEGIMQTLLGFAVLSAQIGLMPTSAHLLGFLAGSSLAKPYRPNAADRITFEQTVNSLGLALGDAQFETERATGRILSVPQAIALAQAIPREVSASASRIHDGSEKLTPREREVTILIARGQSNSEIANELVLSKRTVEHHIASILSKLGFTNRVQIVRWAIESGMTGEKR